MATLLLSVVITLCAIGRSSSKPNIVYILTDDQDVKLGSLSVQPMVKSLLTEQGMFFNNAFVATPVCCPSRSSILTGKYTHNHKTYENSVDKGCSAPSWRNENENHTIGVYMSAAGYKTGLFGKYLNNYALPGSGVGVDHIPLGWDTWYGLKGNSKFYNYIVSNQGVEERHGNNYSSDYFTDRVRDHAVKFIHDSASKAKTGETPFFAYVATPAPHRPATPATQYANKYAGKEAPRSPSYGDLGAGKHWIISNGTPPINSTIAKAIDDLYQLRLESLLSVDDLVNDIVKTLETEGLLDNTFIFYNSDHGYHLGQFKQQGEKRQIYDENIRVPLIVRGPGVKQNSLATSAAVNVDLAPTFLDLAGVSIPDDMDGISLKNVLMGQEQENEAAAESNMVFVEYFGEGSPLMKNGDPVPFIHDCKNNTFAALRYYDNELDVVYSKYYVNDTAPLTEDDGDSIYWMEYYNFKMDPWQLKNLHDNNDTMPADDTEKALEEALVKFQTCLGATCREMRHMKLEVEEYT